MCSGSDLFLALLAVLFPPIAVWIKRGVCTADSLINIALCCLGYLPGLLHAWYIISLFPEPEYTSIPQDQEGQYTVWYMSGGPAPHGQPQYGRQQQGGRTYGTLQTPGGGQFVGQQSGTTNSFQAPKPQKQSGRQEGQGQEQSGAGSSARPEETPPSYADVIKGDNKIQSRD